MGAIAFGLNVHSVRRVMLFILLSMALGGIALGLGGGGFFSVLFGAALVCAMCIFALKGRLGNRLLPVEIRCDKQCHRFTAMIDTGNTLSDPITGQQILVVSSGIGKRLLGQETANFSDPVSVIEQTRGAQLIPYHAVGIAGGLLAAKRFQNVTIGKWHGSCLVAFAPDELGRGEAYEALTGGNLWA
jgi:stage II sporulation protein GA (sporulation sigma-E factor processing peptidase)